MFDDVFRPSYLLNAGPPHKCFELGGIAHCLLKPVFENCSANLNRTRQYKMSIGITIRFGSSFSASRGFFQSEACR